MRCCPFPFKCNEFIKTQTFLKKACSRDSSRGLGFVCGSTYLLDHTNWFPKWIVVWTLSRICVNHHHSNTFSPFTECIFLHTRQLQTQTSRLCSYTLQFDDIKTAVSRWKQKTKKQQETGYKGSHKPAPIGQWRCVFCKTHTNLPAAFHLWHFRGSQSEHLPDNNSQLGFVIDSDKRDKVGGSRVHNVVWRRSFLRNISQCCVLTLDLAI